MSRLTPIRAIVAAAIALALGIAAAPSDARPATSDNIGRHLLIAAAAQAPCALLTAGDVAAALGEAVTWSSAGANSPTAATMCSYATRAGHQVSFELDGGRADFERTIAALQKQAQAPGFGPGCQTSPCLTPLTKVSGVGDTAFLNLSAGDGAQIYVLEGGTYFAITLECKAARCASEATALARQVAGRMR